MKNLGLILALTASVLMSSCKKIDASKGTPVENSVSLSGFSGIDLAMSANLTYTEGNETSITVKSTEKIFEKMNIEVDNGILEFDFKNGYIIKNADQIEIIVTAPDVNSVYLSGSGKLDATFDALITKSKANISVSGSGNLTANNITATNLDISISGSGALNGRNLLATTSEVSISGSGNVELEGSASTNDIRVSGSGSFNGYNYIADDTSIKVSGSGLGKVTANKSLDINISGSGSVFYKGTAVVSQSVTGSGSVTNAN